MAGVAGLLAAVLLAYLRQAANVLGEAGVVVIQALTWIVAAGIASATFAYIYRYGPDRWKAKWRWLSIGSIAATMLWLAATVPFGLYVANFANYNATYGSRSEEHTSELQSLMRISYAVFCLKTKTRTNNNQTTT